MRQEKLWIGGDLLVVAEKRTTANYKCTLAWFDFCNQFKNIYFPHV
jgi:hypothetical protein